MITEVPLDPAVYPLVAYVHYREGRGIILSVVNHAAGVDDSGRRELLLTLDRGGWAHISLAVDELTPDPFPGFVLGTKLPQHGYMRHSDSFNLPGNLAGWVPTATAPQFGRAIPLPTGSPVWKLPVVRMSGAEFCSCDKDTQPPRSACRFCPPGRQESAYLYALAH